MENSYRELTKEQLIALIVKEKKETEKLRKEKEEILRKQEEDGQKALKAIEALQRVKDLDPSKADTAEGNIAKLLALVMRLIEIYENKCEESRLRAKALYGKSSESKRRSPDPKKKKRPQSYRSIIKALRNAAKTVALGVDFASLGLDPDDYIEAGADEILKVEGRLIETEAKLIRKKKYVLKDRSDPEAEKKRAAGKTPTSSKPQYVTAIYEDAFPNSIATPSLAACILTLKYDLGVPYDRLAARTDVGGTRMNEQTISGIGQRAIRLLKPLYGLIVERATKSGYLNADETTLKVIDSNHAKDYVYVFTTGRFSAPACFYSYTGTRSFKANADRFSDYEGWIMCDGFPGYPAFAKKCDGRMRISMCNAHARRMFFDANILLPEEERENSVSGKVIKAYAELYRREEEIKNLKPSERLAKRKAADYQSEVSNLKSLARGCESIDGSTLRKAKDYFLKHEELLFQYLTDGHLEIDNNEAERKIKSIIIPRNNSLFVRNGETAKDFATVLTVIQTARLCGLKVDAYLEYFFSELPGVKDDDYSRLVPWSFSIPKRIRMSGDSPDSTLDKPGKDTDESN